MSTQELQARILGDYELVKELGAGMMGKVYLAQHRFLKKPFVLKILPEELSQNSKFLERFEKEETKFLPFWVFFRKKTVTNPSKKFMTTSCREFADETEHKFDWDSRDQYLNCDYIDFGL